MQAAAAIKPIPPHLCQWVRDIIIVNGLSPGLIESNIENESLWLSAIHGDLASIWA